MPASDRGCTLFIVNKHARQRLFAGTPQGARQNFSAVTIAGRIRNCGPPRLFWIVKRFKCEAGRCSCNRTRPRKTTHRVTFRFSDVNRPCCNTVPGVTRRRSLNTRGLFMVFLPVRVHWVRSIRAFSGYKHFRGVGQRPMLLLWVAFRSRTSLDFRFLFYLPIVISAILCLPCII